MQSLNIRFCTYMSVCVRVCIYIYVGVCVCGVGLLSVFLLFFVSDKETCRLLLRRVQVRIMLLCRLKGIAVVLSECCVGISKGKNNKQQQYTSNDGWYQHFIGMYIFIYFL